MSIYNLTNGWNLFRTENGALVEKGRKVFVLSVATEGTSERAWSMLKLSSISIGSSTADFVLDKKPAKCPLSHSALLLAYSLLSTGSRNSLLQIAGSAIL